MRPLEIVHVPEKYIKDDIVVVRTSQNERDNRLYTVLHQYGSAETGRTEISTLFGESNALVDSTTIRAATHMEWTYKARMLLDSDIDFQKG